MVQKEGRLRDSDFSRSSNNSNAPGKVAGSVNVARFVVGAIDTTRAACAGLHRDMTRALDGPIATPNNPNFKQMSA